ncbi:hypothetical protein, partial [Paraburkholderia sp. NMBU_R16]|uniref:hypothetical protein n=1 Tax=Paraburkholderia sp. NMBU_R16 TaxID=2698676 RepID=UPI001C2541F3
QHAPRVNQQTLVSVNQHRHHQPRRDILILFVARLSSRLSRHTAERKMRVQTGTHRIGLVLQIEFPPRNSDGVTAQPRTAFHPERYEPVTAGGRVEFDQPLELRIASA